MASKPIFAIDFFRIPCFQYKQQYLNQFKRLTSSILIILFKFHYAFEMMGVFQQLHEEFMSTPGTVDETCYWVFLHAMEVLTSHIRIM